MRKQQGSFILKSIVVYFIVAFTILFIVVTLTRKFMTPMEGAAKGFYLALKERKYEYAYLLLSNQRQQELSIYEFMEFVKKNRLHEVANSSWHSPTYNDDQTYGKILGSIQLVNGTNYPIEMSFVLEEDSGRVMFKDVNELRDVPYLDKLKIWKVDKINFNPKIESFSQPRS